jgi:uncharacterized protein YegP (UPF0339 family)
MAVATATKQARSARQRADTSVDGFPSEFLVFQSNNGDYYWVIVSADGTTLAQSGSFASFDAAEEAAIRVRDGAASVGLESRNAGTRSPVAA